MALTPEDVVNKRFQSTKFREGYDQDEVDDFLDEIVVELRRLTQENDELRQRLLAADARIAESQRGSVSAPMQAPTAAMMAAPATLAPMPIPVAGVPAPVVVEPTADTNNLLQLARRLHEEHVREGLAKKEQLIAAGQAEATRIVTEATDGQQYQLWHLEHERVSLQQRVDELRAFEREYRQQLRTYIKGQLTDLEGTAQPDAAPSASTVGSVPAGASAPAYASAPAFGAEAPYPGSAPGQGHTSPQTPPPGQFPGYGS